jgi:hypothetical protein
VRKENRGKFPTKGAANPGPGKTPAGGPYRGVGFKKPEGSTQPGKRSLGFKKIKQSMDEKGL